MNMLHRRAFFKSASTAALAVTATPALAFQMPITETPDPLPEWFRDWKRGTARWEGIPEETPEADQLLAENVDLENRICSTQATSREGVIAQLDLVLDGNSWTGGLMTEASERVVFENIRAALVGGLV